MTVISGGRRPIGPIESLEVSSYRIPTDEPETDGTFAWNATTVVVVEVSAGDRRGLGYSYTDASAALLVRETLAEVVEGFDVMAVPDAWTRMAAAVRNVGRPGIAASAIAAGDSALWDLKARVIDVPLLSLLGSVRSEVPVYGSGGFTCYFVEKLREQLGGWAAEGRPGVKMKVGRDRTTTVSACVLPREAIGPDVQLLVDANGAYGRQEALALAFVFRDTM